MYNKEYYRRYYQKNSGKVKARVSEYATQNREKVLAQRAEYRKNNAQIIRDRAKEYRAQNPDKVRISKRKSTRKRESTDIEFRLTCRLRSRLHHAVKGLTKSASTMSLLGCGISYLRAHLEAQFKPGMTWDNYGLKGWQVDHIRPCKSFDLTDAEQQRQCFHYTNLQPLWWWQNLKKGSR